MIQQAAVSTCGNLIDGKRQEGRGPARTIRNPANPQEVLAEVREADRDQVNAACEAAERVFAAWRSKPAPERARALFKFRDLLEKNFLDLSKSIVRENGKLLSEAKGSLRRGIDVVEFACGIPSLLMGKVLPEVSTDVDSCVVREPLGVVVGIPPFNFPAMIPLWMMPIAVACGNAFILKPSEKTPLTGTRLAELLHEAGAPVNVVQGGKDVSHFLITHPRVSAISSVGSTAAAESIYRTAVAHGKRVQALGGAKNHLLVMPDADLEKSIPALIGSCFGCAGQRCLAGSVLVAVGDAARQDRVVEAFAKAARALKLGDGMDESSTMGPVLSVEDRERIHRWIAKGVEEGASLVLDGRPATGCFVGPTIFDRVQPEMSIAREEIFGPVVSIVRANHLDDAIGISNKSRYGNSASIFTRSGRAAREFRSKIECGLLGVNVGVPAPMAFFSFGGWKSSLFGDLHAHGPDAVEFYTRKKVVTERWFEADQAKEGWV